MNILPKRLSPEQMADAFKSAQKKGLVREEDTALIFYDLDLLEKRIKHLQALFPVAALHALAIKSCPLIRIMEFTRNLGIGVEAATRGEVHLALKTGYIPDKIVFDSPVKTRSDLEFALDAGIHLNIDNLAELNRVKDLLMSGHLSGTIGIRINPQVGTGSIAGSSVAGEYSKFGVPLKNAEHELMQAFIENDWLTGLHLHVGSQGCAPAMLVEGVGRLYDFMLRVNEHTIREKGLAQISVFDIGGGFPVSYSAGTEPPSIDEYAAALAKRAPFLFEINSGNRMIPSGGIRLITEFGRWAFVNSGWTVTEVEYVKHDPGLTTAMIHVGADLFVRECLNPDDWHHEYTVLDKSGMIRKTNPEKSNLAGPLCFGGDILARNVVLPRIAEGDRIIIHDTGGYTFGMWSRYNSRQTPRILAYRNNGEQFQIIKERESFEDLYNFWK